MIDREYNVLRFVAEYSNKSDERIAEYDLSEFDLELFKMQFKVNDFDKAMYACYEIRHRDIDFIKKYIEQEPNWNLGVNSYFVEATAI